MAHKASAGHFHPRAAGGLILNFVNHKIKLNLKKSNKKISIYNPIINFLSFEAMAHGSCRAANVPTSC